MAAFYRASLTALTHSQVRRRHSHLNYTSSALDGEITPSLVQTQLIAQVLINLGIALRREGSEFLTFTSEDVKGG